MSHSDRPGTDRQSAGDAPESAPSAWVRRWLRGVAPGARVLDFAAGDGRHARLARSLGARVLAVDRDAAALAAMRAVDGIATTVVDLEAGRWALEPASFDAVIVSRYLYRPRFALLCGLLAPGGRLVYETFGIGNEAFGKPSNPAFLLREGELLDRARLAGLTVVAYESGYASEPKPAIVQRLCALRPPFERAGLALDAGREQGEGGALG